MATSANDSRSPEYLIDAGDELYSTSPVDVLEYNDFEDSDDWKTVIQRLTSQLGFNKNSNFLKQIEQDVNKISGESSASLDGLDKNEIAALYIFQLHFFHDQPWKTNVPDFATQLNRALRDQTELEECLRHYMTLLLNALRKIPSKRGIVWRAAKGNISGRFRVDDMVNWCGVSICEEIKGTLMNYVSKYNTVTIFRIKCCDGKDISDLNDEKASSLILLMPNSTFRVVKNNEKSSKYPVVYLEQIHTDSNYPTSSNLKPAQSKQDKSRSQKKYESQASSIMHTMSSRSIGNAKTGSLCTTQTETITLESQPTLILKLVERKKDAISSTIDRQLYDLRAQKQKSLRERQQYFEQTIEDFEDSINMLLDEFEESIQNMSLSLGDPNHNEKASAYEAILDLIESVLNEMKSVIPHLFGLYRQLICDLADCPTDKIEKITKNFHDGIKRRMDILGEKFNLCST